MEILPLNLIDTSTISSLVYLDYMFNPCSVVSMELSMTKDQFDKTLFAMNAEKQVVIKFPILSNMMFGEVVSYTAKVGADLRYHVSALVLPVGVAHTTKTSIGYSTYGKPLKSKTVAFNALKLPIDRPYGYSDGDLNIVSDMGKTDSFLSTVMFYRRAFLQRGFKVMPDKAPHRLLYVPMASSGPTKSPAAVTVKVDASTYVFADVDMAAPPEGDSMDSLLSGMSQANFDYTIGSQGLLNSAFSYVPRGNNQFQSLFGQFVNTTLDLNITNAVPVALQSLLFDSLKPDTWKAFRTYKATGNKILTPPWGDSKLAYHLKTMYTFASEPGGVSPSHSLSLSFGRYNPALVPGA